MTQKCRGNNLVPRPFPTQQGNGNGKYKVLIGRFTTVQKRLPDPEPQHLSDPFRIKPSLAMVVISIKKKLS